MIISHSHRFTFVHIHKTGGTSIERALDPHLAWYDLILGGSPFGEQLQQPYAERFKLHKHSSVADIEQLCGPKYIEQYFLFAVVRHPVARACSLYNFAATTLTRWATKQGVDLNEVSLHITEKAAKKKPGLNWASSRAFMASRNFSDFIRDERTCGAPGFRTQVSSLKASSGNVIGRFYRIEEHDSWAASLADKLGIELHLPHANASTVKLADDRMVSDEDRRYLEGVFGEDYEAFGY